MPVPKDKQVLYDIHWLAGIIEGEGCFFSGGTSISLYIKMSDEDVIKKAADIMGCEYVKATKNNPKYKDLWSVRVGTMKAVEWMFTLYPLMSSRRKEKIRECIKKWIDLRS